MANAKHGPAAADQDPRGFVEAPVVDALNRIILRATAGFALVAGFATFPLLFQLPPGIHEAFHLLLPLGAIGYVAVTITVLLLRPAPEEPDPWGRAAAVDAGLARLARRVSLGMALGWLAAVGAVLVHHHLGSSRDVLTTVLVDVPFTLAIWLAAVVVTGWWSRASLARAEHAVEERLRTYWSGLAPTRRTK